MNSSDAGRLDRYFKEAQALLAEREARWRRAKRMKFDTLAVHGLYTMEEAIAKNQGAIIEPLFLASAQAYRDSDELEAALSYQIPTWCYTRIHNPTLGYLEDTLALLETYGSEIRAGCCVYSSGMAAIENVTDTLLVRLGDEPPNFVSQCQIYGGTFQQFNVRKFQERGIEVRWVLKPEDVNEWRKRIDKNTRFLYAETPSNPGLQFFDLKPVIELAHEHGIPMVVDSTIASPALLRPLTLGADIVIHSATKVMSSSGMGMAGAVIARQPIVTSIPNEEMKSDFALYLKRYPQRDQGGCLHPFQALMTLNDLRDLRHRVDLLSRNALTVAQFLAGHPKVLEVSYLGLESHPLHSVAKRYLKLADSDENRYTHLLAFRVKGGPEKTRQVFDRFRLIYRATDLGRIKTVATIPAISTHLLQGEECREMACIPPDLIRLSVGAEDPSDVIADLEQALSGV